MGISDPGTGAIPAIFDDHGFNAKAANDFMRQVGYGGLLNVEYSNAGEDWVELTIDWRSDLVGDPASGVMASAVVISLLDNATSMSIWQKHGTVIAQATMDLRVDYLRPSPPGKRLYGRGICYHLSRKIGFVRGIAHNGDMDDPLAYASGTFIRLGTA